jgi:hypothetical protein
MTDVLNGQALPALTQAQGSAAIVLALVVAWVRRRLRGHH